LIGSEHISVNKETSMVLAKYILIICGQIECCEEALNAWEISISTIEPRAR